MNTNQFQSSSSNESTDKSLDTNNSHTAIEEIVDGNSLKRMKYIETADVPVPLPLPDWVPIPVTECSSETVNVHHETKNDKSTFLGSRNLELDNIGKNVKCNNDHDKFERLDCISTENTNNSNTAIEEVEEENSLKRKKYIETADVPLPIPVTECSSETVNVHHETKNDKSTFLGSRNLELDNIGKNVKCNNDHDKFERLDCISTENTNNSHTAIEELEDGNSLKRMKYIETADVPVPLPLPDWVPIPVTETVNVHHETKNDKSIFLGSRNLELDNIGKNIERNNDHDKFERLDCILTENTNNSNTAIEGEKINPLKRKKYIVTTDVPASLPISDWLPIPVTESSNYNYNLPVLDTTTRQNIIHSSDDIVTINTNQFQSIFNELRSLRHLINTNHETNQRELSEIKFMIWKQNFNRSFPTLPAKDPSDIYKMESELSNAESHQLMITHLHQCFRPSLNNTIKFILDTIMSDDCAGFYRNDQFPMFKRLQIFKIIIDVSVAVHPTKTKVFASKLIRKWIQSKSTRIETYVRGEHLQSSPMEASVPSFINIKQEPLSPDQQEPGLSFEYN